MGVQVLGFDGNPYDQRSIFSMGDRFITQMLYLSVSGLYVTNGIPLDFTNGGGTPAAPNVVPPAAASGSVGPSMIIPGSNTRGNVTTAYQVAVGGTIGFLDGADPSSWLLVLYDSSGAQIANGTDLTGGFYDAVILAHWAR